MDTTWGHVAFRCWRLRAEGKTTCPLDRLLGVARQGRACPALKRSASELASSQEKGERQFCRQAGVRLQQQRAGRTAALRADGQAILLNGVVEEPEEFAERFPGWMAGASQVKWAAHVLGKGDGEGSSRVGCKPWFVSCASWSARRHGANKLGKRC